MDGPQFKKKTQTPLTPKQNQTTTPEKNKTSKSEVKKQIQKP